MVDITLLRPPVSVRFDLNQAPLLATKLKASVPAGRNLLLCWKQDGELLLAPSSPLSLPLYCHVWYARRKSCAHGSHTARAQPTHVTSSSIYAALLPPFAV